MPDIVDPKTRSRIMSRIRSKNTKPELIIRRGLHKMGFRFRLHSSAVPGTPDLILPRYKVAVFVHGCFWHGHSCHLFRIPSTRPEFWRTKIERNVERDSQVTVLLLEKGWRKLTIWECALKGKKKLDLDELFQFVESWIKGDEQIIEIEGSK